MTWGLDVEEPSAFSSALLVLAADRADPALYVGFIFLGSVLVAAAFAVWRRHVYERRALPLKLRELECDVAVVDRGRPP